jgi:hypothetical protein
MEIEKKNVMWMLRTKPGYACCFYKDVKKGRNFLKENFKYSWINAPVF